MRIRQIIIITGLVCLSLAEKIRIDNNFWQVEVNQAPAFPLRIFSEEGQLIDIPDRGYFNVISIY